MYKLQVGLAAYVADLEMTQPLFVDSTNLNNPNLNTQTTVSAVLYSRNASIEPQWLRRDIVLLRLAIDWPVSYI